MLAKIVAMGSVFVMLAFPQVASSAVPHSETFPAVYLSPCNGEIVLLNVTATYVLQYTGDLSHSTDVVHMDGTGTGVTTGASYGFHFELVSGFQTMPVGSKQVIHSNVQFVSTAGTSTFTGEVVYDWDSDGNFSVLHFGMTTGGCLGGT
jgi:hypothetical protein